MFVKNLNQAQRDFYSEDIYTMLLIMSNLSWTERKLIDVNFYLSGAVRSVLSNSIDVFVVYLDELSFENILYIFSHVMYECACGSKFDFIKIFINHPRIKHHQSSPVNFNLNDTKISNIGRGIMGDEL